MAATPDTLAPVACNDATWTVILDGTETADTLLQVKTGAPVQIGVKATSGDPAAGVDLAPGETVVFGSGSRVLGLGSGSVVRQPL